MYWKNIKSQLSERPFLIKWTLQSSPNGQTNIKDKVETEKLLNMLIIVHSELRKTQELLRKELSKVSENRI